MAQQQRFWEVDLIELAKSWLDDLGTFFLTAVTFAGLALPVIIPILVLWFLFSIGFRADGPMTLAP